MGDTTLLAPRYATDTGTASVSRPGVNRAAATQVYRTAAAAAAEAAQHHEWVAGGGDRPG